MPEASQASGERRPEASGERRIVVTESAARRIAFLKQQEEAADARLRIAVSGGGCSGFQYGMSFDDQQNPDDYLFERDGVGVIVDDTSLDLLSGAGSRGAIRSRSRRNCRSRRRRRRWGS
jgi:iron-sulfur cluster assembly accessory protein